MYNPLIDTPMREVCGVKINTSYRVVLTYMRLLRNRSIADSEEELAGMMLNLIYELEGVELTAELVGKLVEAIPRYINLGEDSEDESTKERVFDILQDSGAIASAFLQAYGIDLTREGSLHWWDFVVLLRNLPKGTRVADIVHIRSMKIPKDAKAEQVREIQALKDSVKLEETRTDEQIKKHSEKVLQGIFDSW